MAKSHRSVVATDKHSLRLVQQVASGSPGAYVDALLGASWSRSRQGLNGRGGFIQVENAPVLGDQSDFTILLPPVGSDGVKHQDRFYCLADTPDLLNPSGPRVGYAPGDEWIEVYRGTNELVACGTPVTWQVQPDQLTIVCRDVLQPLKKQQETAGGFWCHSPRDTFEHYTRVWQTVLAEDFPDSAIQFPGSPSSTGAVTPNGRWGFVECSAQGGASYARLHGGGGVAPSLSGTPTWLDLGNLDHSCWRAEVRVSGMWASGAQLFLTVGTGTNYVQVRCSPLAGYADAVTVSSTTGTITWPLLPTGLADTNNRLMPPYTLAIEARDRWYLFYLDGQLVGNALRPVFPVNTQVGASFSIGGMLSGEWADVDWVVIRKTTAPLNAGNVGDYRLPASPTPGGLNGEYFDLGTLPNTTSPWKNLLLAGSPAFPAAKVAERIDPGLGNFDASTPTWQPATLTGQFFVRWTGAIRIPLGDQDVTFALPTGGYTDRLRVWIGQTRAQEHILTNFAWDTLKASSGSMRALLGSVSGWYPIVVEYLGFGTTHTKPGFTWSVTGGNPTPQDLAPLGCYRGQVSGGSHYDMLRALTQSFSYQWKGEPRQLESGSFPGIVVPYGRVGRDTDYVLDETEAFNPQAQVTAEDVAQTLTAQASGLGGNNAGTLTAEIFNFDGMRRHPFVSSESDSSPTTTVGALLVQHLITLLGLRGEPWEDVQTQSIGQRQMQDSFPLSGLLAEFDWAVGDGLRLNLPSIGVTDITPRQIISLKRMLYPDGMGEHTAGFRPRPRNIYETIRTFARQVYGDRRTFQGQLVNEPSTSAASPGYSTVVLPNDISTIVSAELAILSKDDATTTFDLEINGTIVAVAAITKVGIINIGQWVGRNLGVQPQLIARLINPSATCNVTYTLRLRTLIDAA